MSAYVFDTETTGSAVNSEIIEAAWMRINDPTHQVVEASWEQRFKPSRPIELGALAVHHILDEDLVDCLPSATFALPSDAAYIIGHNIDYDWNVSGTPNIKRICTLALSRAYVPNLESYSLSAMIYYFFRLTARGRLKNAHSALADTDNCFQLLVKLIEVIEKKHETPITSWESLWELSEKARIPRIMPFGKHKGDAISSLPKSYQNWLLNQDSIDPYIKQAIKTQCA